LTPTVDFVFLGGKNEVDHKNTYLPFGNLLALPPCGILQQEKE
jgi:hypothetical protein